MIIIIMHDDDNNNDNNNEDDDDDADDDDDYDDAAQYFASCINVYTVNPYPKHITIPNARHSCISTQSHVTRVLGPRTSALLSHFDQPRARPG